MGRALAASLGWVAPSERFSKTVENAQLTAYQEGAQEVSVEHFFSAALEDLDAVYFLARHEIPLAKLDSSKIAAGRSVQDVPRLAPPSYGQPYVTARPVTPHLEIPASAALRRIIGIASALAEARSMIEVHGGLAFEAILEDGKSQAAAALKRAHAETAQDLGRRLPPLPASAHQGAMIVVQAPPRGDQRPPAAPRPSMTSAEQIRWLSDQIARALELERPYRFLKELNAFADKDRPFASMAAFQIREEAQAELAVNPVFLCQAELQSASRAVEEAEARVRQAALRVGEAKPQIFNTLLTLVSDSAAAALKAAQKLRDEERAAIAAMQAQAAQHQQPYQFYNAEAAQDGAPAAGQPAPLWHRTGFPRPLTAAGDDHDREEATGDNTYPLSLPRAAKSNGHIFAHGTQAKAQIKKTLARLGRIWSAGAGMMHFLF